LTVYYFSLCRANSYFNQLRSSVSSGFRDLLWKEEGILPSPLWGLPRRFPEGWARRAQGPAARG